MCSTLCREKVIRPYSNSKSFIDSYIGTDWTDLDYAYDFLSFINKNPTEFHAAEWVTKLLEQHGFVYLPERADWGEYDEFIDIVAGNGGKFYTTRNGSSVIAAVVGPDWKPSDGVGLVGAHIDALTVKLKPNSIVPTSDDNGAFIRLGVAPYSGDLTTYGLIETWDWLDV